MFPPAPKREALPEDDPEKLLRLPAQVEGDAHLQVCAELVANVESRKSVLLRGINQRNLGYFEQEVQSSILGPMT